MHIKTKKNNYVKRQEDPLRSDHVELVIFYGSHLVTSVAYLYISNPQWRPRHKRRKQYNHIYSMHAIWWHLYLFISNRQWRPRRKYRRNNIIILAAQKSVDTTRCLFYRDFLIISWWLHHKGYCILSMLVSTWELTYILWLTSLQRLLHNLILVSSKA